MTDGSVERAGEPAGGPAGEPTPADRLAALADRRARLSEASRPEQVDRRHAEGRRTAREQLGAVLDAGGPAGGTWVEWGAHRVAAQRARHPLAELLTRTPGDGVVCGLGEVDGAPVAVLAYDYTVLAGTQGYAGHAKTDRFLAVVRRLGVPLLLLAEGGGGRPSDTELTGAGGLDLATWQRFAQLPGPTVGLVSGRCFAGNALLLGLCDARVAVAGSSIGVGGPAMVAAAGLGHVEPDDVGPAELHRRTGLVDQVVPDDAAAAALARQLLGLLAGRAAPQWDCADQALLRDVLPASRRRAYPLRDVVRLLADTGSVVELGSGHARAVHTALVRVEGRPVAVLGTDPLHHAGALTAEACDKAARFLQLAERRRLPVLSLVDTPGIMVGTDAERAGTVAAGARLFAAGAALTVPLLAVVLRKAYGLGAMAVAGGSFAVPLATVSWPTGELGGMALEGAVRLALRRELAALPEEEREPAYRAALAAAYDHGQALSAATLGGELDDVVDPAETRDWVRAVLLR